MDIIDVIQSEKDGQFYWHRKAPNHKIISRGEGHPRRWGAFRAARRANPDNDWTFGPESLARQDED